MLKDELLDQWLVDRMQEDQGHTMVSIKSINEEKQIVYAEVYAPNVIDTHGELMDAEEIEAMAHKFMQLDLANVSDVNHDNNARDCYIVESFIARKGDPDYTEGAWVLGTKIVDETIWDAVKKGELNGYSFEALVRKRPAVAVIEVTRDNLGITEEADGHVHIFFAELNDDGVIMNGRTTTDNNHSHEIKKGTATEAAAGHKHRIFV